MKNQLSAKQLVRFPYCRIYRRFLNGIVENPRVRKQGHALLFRYAVLFSLANFRPALRTVYGVRGSEYRAQFGSDWKEDFAPAYRRTRQYLLEEGDVTRIRDEYLFVQNRILSEYAGD